MIRRLNYTNRIKIKREDIRVLLQKTSSVNSFKAELKLDSNEIPKDAMVFIEAYRLTTRMRFCFGTVGKFQAPADTALTNFDTSDGILFHIKITSAGTEHILFAEADRIPLIDPDEKEVSRLSLLPVVLGDLGDEVWRLSFEDQPMLIINSKIGDWHGIARSGVFSSLVYPSVMREILFNILFIQRYDDADDAEYPMSQWLKFAKTFTERELPQLDDKEDLTEWIDAVVSKFAAKVGAYEKFMEIEKKGAV